MTVIKRHITEIESVVNQADNRKTAGKIYLPKDWIGKKVKTILLSSLIVMAVLVIISSSQAVKADLFSDTIKKLGDAISNDTVRCVGETGKIYTQCHDEVMRQKP